ncbi:MAG: hypothetical protein WC325_10895 [Candidatus Bathyarchaeia archaeon]|jgi:hypothetical protein
MITQPEQQIAKIEGISSSSRNTNYNLYLTDNRMIFIKSQPTYNPVSGGLLGGIVSEAIFHLSGRKQKKEEKEQQNMTLNEKLEQNKGCFAIAYTDIQEIRMHAGWTSEFSVSLKNSKVKLFWTEKNQIDQLANELAKVAILQDKIQILK